MKKYENFCSNLDVLSRAGQENLENEFIISGIIDKFFVQFELSWKLMKALLQYEGAAAAATGSPREIIKASYGIYDFMNEKIWLSMLRDRNDMTHRYDGEAAERLVEVILHTYLPEFTALRQGLLRRYDGKLPEV